MKDFTMYIMHKMWPYVLFFAVDIAILEVYARAYKIRELDPLTIIVLSLAWWFIFTIIFLSVTIIPQLRIKRKMTPQC